MASLEALHHAVTRRILDAAADPIRWPHMLGYLAGGLGASKASMHEHQFSQKNGAQERHLGGNRTHSHGYDFASAFAYQKHFAWQDPYVNAIRRRHRGLAAGTSDELISETELTKSTFYNEYGRQNGIYYVAWSIVEQGSRQASGLALIRPESLGQFDHNEVAFIRTLTPDLQAAFGWQRVLEQQQAFLNSWDHLDYATFRISAQGHILQKSLAAADALESLKLLRNQHGKLRAVDPDSDDRLQRLLREMRTCSTTGVAACCDTVLLLNRQTGREAPLTLIRCGSGLGRYPEAEDGSEYYARLYDTSSAIRSRSSVLQKIWGLTASEIRIVDYLAQGNPLTTAKAGIGVEYATARSRLKVIYNKMGVFSQEELIALVQKLGGDAPLTPDEKPIELSARP